MKRLFPTLLALIVMPLFGTQVTPQVVQVTGDWDVTLNTPNGSRQAKATFKQDGEKLSGVFKNERGQVPCQGSIKGKEIEITYTVKYEGQDLTIVLTGKTDGDLMSGRADFGGFAEGDWVARRVVGGGATTEKKPASAPSSDQKHDVSGVWVAEVETSQGTASPTLTFRQEGEKLTGEYKGAFHEGRLAGTVKGNKVVFSFTVPGESTTFTFSGTIEKNTMRGTAELGSPGPGTWTAKRR
jgi:hypothetical protein